MSDALIRPKCFPSGFVQKVWGFSGSRTEMWPLMPSVKPFLAKIRKAPVPCYQVHVDGCCIYAKTDQPCETGSMRAACRTTRRAARWEDTCPARWPGGASTPWMRLLWSVGPAAWSAAAVLAPLERQRGPWWGDIRADEMRLSRGCGVEGCKQVSMYVLR